MPLFPKSWPVLRRQPGILVDGVIVPAADPVPETVELNIQPASLIDYQRTEAMPGGRRVSALLKAYGEPGLVVAGENRAPGDLVQYSDGKWYLVIGAAVRNSLDDPDVSHVRYLLAREIEVAPGEVAV